jgi:hypothetical protein
MANNKKAANPGQGVAAQKTNHDQKSIKKIYRVEAALKLPAGLNRFEAERIGDHCLNSTVADIRKSYGARLVQKWEMAPSRYCSDGVRVLRYWIVGGAV